jgi:hypothetical protein
MKHPPALGRTILVLRTRVFALGAAHRARALAAPFGAALPDWDEHPPTLAPLAAPPGAGQSVGAALPD